MISFGRYIFNKIYSEFLIRRDHHTVIQELRKRKKRYIIIFGSPIHGNLGDHAISCAERAFIEKHFSECGIIEISSLSYLYAPDKYQKVIRTDDILLITGGGFLGDLWENEDRFVKNVIQSFPNNSVIIMPQSVFFCDEKKLLETRIFLKDYPNLFLFAREANSFQLFCELYDKKRVFLVPDAVLSLERNTDLHSLRKGVLLCFRKDKEKTMRSDLENLICEELRSKSMKFKYIDTVEMGIISFKSRNKYLNKKLDSFSNAQLVITDRLHGMIFSIITHTPCIAIDNLSRKISGVYEWIKELPYVRIINLETNITSSDIEKAIMVCNAPTDQDAPMLLKDAFYPIEQVIKRCLEKR